MFLYRQTNLPELKEIRNALQSIFGIGWHKSLLISAKIGIPYPFSIDNLNYYNFYVLSNLLNIFTWLEVRIKRVISFNLIELADIICYRGFRHGNRLPCRGQRTRTNARTRKRIVRLT